MATIQPASFRPLIGTPHDFVWAEKQKLALTSSGTAVYAIDARSPDFASYSGKSVTITVGAGSPVPVTFGSTANAASAVSQINTATSTSVAAAYPDGSGYRLQDTVGLETSYGTEGDFATIGIPTLQRGSASTIPSTDTWLEYSVQSDRIDRISDAFAVADGANVLNLTMRARHVKGVLDIRFIAVWDYVGDWDYSFTGSTGIVYNQIYTLAQAPVPVIGSDGAATLTGSGQVVMPTPFVDATGLTMLTIMTGSVPVPSGGAKKVRIFAVAAKNGSNAIQSKTPIVSVTGAWAFNAAE